VPKINGSQIQDRQVTFGVDGAGSAISTGLKDWVRVPYSGTIVLWELTAKESGSVVCDIYKSDYASAPPASGSIVGAGTKPALSSAQRNKSTSPAFDTLTVSAGDYLRLNIDSASTVTKIKLILEID